MERRYLGYGPHIRVLYACWSFLENRIKKKDVYAKYRSNLKNWITCARTRNNSFRLDKYAKIDKERIAISQVKPLKVKVGDKLTIKGHGFGPYQAWINVAIGGKKAEVISYNKTKGELVCEVPRGARDNCLIELDVNGFPNIEPFYIDIKPTVVYSKCPDFAALKIEVLGTSHPCLIDVTRQGALFPEQTFSLKTNYFSGVNSCLLPLGGVSGKFFRDSIKLASIIDPMLLGLPALSPALSPVLFALNYIQLVAREEKDPKTGKTIIVYYFFRDGKWWRVKDPNKKHPRDKKGIDLRETEDPNFEEADAKTAAKLNEDIFPTDWQKKWKDFEEHMARDLQMMSHMLLAMQGISEEEAGLVMQIRQMLHSGRSLDEILEIKWWEILKILLIAAATAGALKVLGRFLRILFKTRLLKKLTQVDELDDEITITVKKKHQPSNTKKGIQGEIKGKVDKTTGTLECDPTSVDWVNKTGQKGLATDLFEEWIKLLVEYAKKKGLKRVRIRRAASSKSGEKLMERLGFKKIFNGESGSVWEKVIDVK